MSVENWVLVLLALVVHFIFGLRKDGERPYLKEQHVKQNMQVEKVNTLKFVSSKPRVLIRVKKLIKWFIVRVFSILFK